MTLNLILAASFVVLGAAATILQHWLWRFPMLPDPTGTDPNGVTSAPAQWRRAHRVLGYGFALTYVALLVRMIPRLFTLDADLLTPATLAHIVLGLVIAPVLVMKVLIIRRFQRWGNRLRFIGTMLFVVALAVVAIPAPAALELQRLPAESSADQMARAIVIQDCTRCHGASTILAGSDDDWPKVIEEMQENAEKMSLAIPAQGNEPLVANYLQRTLASASEDGDKDRRRNRGSRIRREDD